LGRSCGGAAGVARWPSARDRSCVIPVLKRRDDEATEEAAVGKTRASDIKPQVGRVRASAGRAWPPTRAWTGVDHVAVERRRVPLACEWARAGAGTFTGWSDG